MRRLFALVILSIVAFTSATEAQRGGRRAGQVLDTFRTTERPPGLRETPADLLKSGNGREAPAQPSRLKNLEESLGKPDQKPEEIRIAFEKFVASRAELSLQEAQFIRAFIADKPTEIVSMNGENPNILIRTPIDDAYKPAADILFRSAVQPHLNKNVDRDSLVLMPLLISNDAKFSASQIAPGRQTLRGALGEITHGDFNHLDASMFASLRGKTLIVVGHVVDHGGRPSFEIRNGETRKYITLHQLQQASEKVGFNLIPLGCETKESFTVGTAAKITDVDGVEAFKRAIATGGRTSYLHLLSDLSSKDLKLLIDPKTARSNLIPIDLVDVDGRIVERPPKGGGPAASFNSSRGGEGTSSRLGGTSIDVCEMSQAQVNMSSHYSSLISWLREWQGTLYIIITITILFVLMIENYFHEGPTYNFEISNGEQTIIRSIRVPRQNLAYDDVVSGFYFCIWGAVYCFVGSAIIRMTALDQYASESKPQWLIISAFALCVLYLIYFFSSYKIQRHFNKVPNYLWYALSLTASISFLFLVDAVVYGLFVLFITVLLVAIPIILFRKAIDDNWKYFPWCLLLLSFFQVFVLLSAWGWSAAKTECVLVEPRPLYSIRGGPDVPPSFYPALSSVRRLVWPSRAG